MAQIAKEEFVIERRTFGGSPHWYRCRSGLDGRFLEARVRLYAGLDVENMALVDAMTSGTRNKICGMR